MEISDILSLQGVLANLKAGSKKQLLQELAAVAAKETGIHERTIFDVLLERERLGSTGVGKGIAIPHGKLSDIDRLYGVFARLPSAVDFESIDEQPVDLIFLLLAPADAGADHLKALARISRLLRADDVCTRLRGSEHAEALFALLTQTAETPAA